MTQGETHGRTSSERRPGGDAPSVSVIIMGLNEAESLPFQLRRSLDYLGARRASGAITDYELIYVDDGSSDASVSIAEEVAEADPHVRVLVHAKNRGIGAAIRSGYEAATMDWMCQLPADAQIPPEVFDGFLPHVGDADMIIGRYTSRGDGPLRGLLTQGFRLTARALLGHPSDFTGTHLVRRDLSRRVSIGADTFFANIELPLKLMGLGVRPRFVPIAPPELRRHGQSRVASAARIRRVVTEMLALRRRLKETAPELPNGGHQT